MALQPYSSMLLSSTISYEGCLGTVTEDMISILVLAAHNCEEVRVLPHANFVNVLFMGSLKPLESCTSNMMTIAIESHEICLYMTVLHEDMLLLLCRSSCPSLPHLQSRFQTFCNTSTMMLPQ